MNAINKIFDRFHEAILKNDVDIAVQDIKANRLNIYLDGYRARLTNAIRSDYPATLHLLGGKLFDQLALAFIEANPSRSFNLDPYPHGFAAFIAGNPDKFASEVAELESAIAQTFMAAESSPLTVNHLQELTEAAFAKQPLLPRTASKLLEFTYPVNHWFTEERAGKKPDIPQQHASYLYVYRHDNEARRLELPYEAYLLMERLFISPSLEKAIEAAASAHPQQADEIMRNVQQWFAQWLKKGVFRIDS